MIIVQISTLPSLCEGNLIFYFVFNVFVPQTKGKGWGRGIFVISIVYVIFDSGYAFLRPPGREKENLLSMREIKKEYLKI